MQNDVLAPWPSQGPPGLTLHTVKNALEAALICAGRPVPLSELVSMFHEAVGPDTVRTLLDELALEYRERGVEILCVYEGWTVRSRPEYTPLIERASATEKAPRYSSAVLQVLAVIAYRQPVTRGDIEEVRGVAVSSSTLQQLEERGWIETIGYRSAPGSPALWATTGKFLDDLGLKSLDELPPIEAGQPAEFLPARGEQTPDPLATAQGSPAASDPDSLSATENNALSPDQAKLW